MSFSVSRALRPDTDAAAVVPAAVGAVCERWTWSAGGHIPDRSVFNRDGVQGFGPRVFRRAYLLSAVSGDRLTVPNLANFETYADGFFDGAAVRVYRVTGGVLTLAREDTVARGHMRERYTALSGSTQAVPGGTTTWRWSPSVVAPFYRRPAALWFAVSTVAANGTFSPPSAWVSWTTPATFVSTTPSNASPITVTRTTETGALTAPTGVAVATENDGQVAAITWNAVAGAHGYVVWRTQYDPATPLLWDTIDLVGGVGKAAVLPTDLIVLDRKIAPGATMASLYTDRVTFAETDALPPTALGFQEAMPGVTFSTVNDPVEGERLRVAVAGGTTRNFGWFTHSGTGQSRPHYWPVMDPDAAYGITIRARGAVGGEVLTLRQGEQSGTVDRTVTLTTQWADHTVVFPKRALNTTANIHGHNLIVTGPVTFDIASFVVHRAEPGDVALRVAQDDLDRIADIAPSFLRMSGFIKTNPWTYNLDAITGPVGTYHQGVRGVSLPSMLHNCAATGVNPWLQIEWVWTDAEWLGLIEYLCAPYDPGTDTPASKPWAYRRHAQGRTAPWIDAFSAIRFEHGNENWNTTEEFYTLPGFSGATDGAVNGLMLDRIVSVFRSSPYWSPAVEAKFQFVLSGWDPEEVAGDTYTMDSAAASLEADWIMYADYNGGWDSGVTIPPSTSDPAAWQQVIGNVVERGLRATIAKANAAQEAAPVGRTKPLRVGTYEAGPGYAFSGITQQQKEDQEYIMKSVGAATSTIDGFLLSAANGVESQNYFIYGAGGTWASHSPWQEGGVLNPPAMLLGFIARELLPGTVAEAPPLVVPEITLNSNTDGALSVYRINANNGKTAIVLCNRSTAGPLSATIRVDLGTTATLYTMTGDYQTHNTTLATADAVAISGSVVATSKKFTATVPAGETIIYIWGAA